MSKIKAWTPNKPKINAKRQKHLEEIKQRLEPPEKVAERRSERLQAEKLKKQRRKQASKKQQERTARSLDNTTYSHKKQRVRFIKHNQ